MWLLNAMALALLLARMRTILDVWLVVTVFVSLPDLSLSFFYEVVRYSVGWYTAALLNRELLCLLPRESPSPSEASGQAFSLTRHFN